MAIAAAPALPVAATSAGSAGLSQSSTRSATGQVQGVKWHDLNGDALRTPDEPLLEGWTIYADLNNDGDLDSPDEPFAITDALGAYSLTLPTGTNVLREVQQPGYIQTAPQGEGGTD